MDTGASSVMNACRARLRMTPLALQVAKKGSFRCAYVCIPMPGRMVWNLQEVLGSKQICPDFWNNPNPRLMDGFLAIVNRDVMDLFLA